VKLVTYRQGHGPYQPGAVIGERIVDVAKGIRLVTHGEAALSYDAGDYRLDMRRLLEWGLMPAVAAMVENLEEQLARGEERLQSLGVIAELNKVTLGPPILEPSKMVAVALNYQSHAEEAGVPIPKAPPLFPKYPSNLVGHKGLVKLPGVSSKIDYEGELALVIGSYASNVSRADAYSVIFGYSIMNDVTARDYQHMTSQFTAGKCMDTFAPTGPWIITSDEVPSPHELALETFVNDELRQEDSTGGMIFDIPDLIEYITSVMTLLPGDIIATGTPGGVGAFAKPPRWLEDGDTVRVSISGIGDLENGVAA